MSDRGKVHPDLMCSPRFERRIDERRGNRRLETLQHVVMRARLAARCLDGHLQGRRRVERPIGSVDDALICVERGRAPVRCSVRPMLVSRQLIDQVCMGVRRASDHQEARGVLVQSMDDSWSHRIAGAGRDEVGKAVDQSRNERVVDVSGPRVHHQPRRFVDHDDGIVFVDDGKGDDVS